MFLRVSFDRVAEQLPVGAFHAPLDRIAASLSEPGHLLVPQRLVVAQLPEGFVRAGWDVVAEQFPRHLLSMADEEITRNLAGGQLVLPLDEIVPQLSPDVFALSGRSVDVQGIESMPAPFTPILAEEGVQGQTEVRTSGTPPIANADAATKAEWSFAGQEGTEDPPVEMGVLEDVELDPILMGPAEGGSLSAIDLRRRQSRGESVEDLMAWSRPVWTADVAGPPAPEASTESVKAPPDLGEIATRHRIIAALGPLRPLDVHAEPVGRLTLFTLSPSGLDRDAALPAVRALLPLLAEGRTPWPVNQLTMRSADTVLILTPLGVTGWGGPVLASVVPPGGAVASIERLSLRAVAEGASDIEGSPGSNSNEPEERQEPDLLDSEPPTRVHQIAASLGALGPVTAGVLRDVETGRDFFLFLPEGGDLRTTGRFAGELEQAMRKVAESGHTFHTAVLRSGRRRLIIRITRAATGRATIVVAGGVTERPGLACRQVEGAALALSAS